MTTSHNKTAGPGSTGGMSGNGGDTNSKSMGVAKPQLAENQPTKSTPVATDQVNKEMVACRLCLNQIAGPIRSWNFSEMKEFILSLKMCCGSQANNWTEEDDAEYGATQAAGTSQSNSGKDRDSEEIKVDEDGTCAFFQGPSPPDQSTDPEEVEHQPPFDSDLPIDEATENAEAEVLEQETNLVMDRTHNTLFEFRGEESLLFRREWNNNEVPVSVVGSTIVDGAVVYLVRIRNYDANDPVGDPMDFSNCVMVLLTIMVRHFPQMLVGYYEHRLGPYGLEHPIIAAAKEEILRRCAMMQ